MRRDIEILAPAGSYESLRAAIAAGADAVYIGGTRFGARAFADNLEEDLLLEAIDYVHLRGKKIYLTVNTLLKESELSELYAYLLPYYKQGLDAVIVQDLGVLQFIRCRFPDLPIHASTQMTVTGVEAAKFLERQGVERVVTSREMNLAEIGEIAQQTDLEIESFVHGALCYCYSGQCLYSSLLGGRSGNRGQCAQPCRLPYRVQGEKDAKYVLSLKDICTLELIPQLVESGICSFKIEGRMKKPEYVAFVTAMYRKYVDLYLQKGTKAFCVDKKDKEKLLDLYNRGGFHDGYYHTQNGREMVSLERPNHAGVAALQVLSCAGNAVTAKALVELHRGDVIELPDGKENYTLAEAFQVGQTISLRTHKRQAISAGSILYRTRNEQLLKEIAETYLVPKKKEKIKGILRLSAGEYATLSLQQGEHSVELTGALVERALNQPMDAARIEKQMRKTGNTPFEFEELCVEADADIFLPMQALNELRRNGLEALEAAILRSFRREEKAEMCSDAVIQKETPQQLGFSVYVEEAEQFYAAADSGLARRIYVDASAVSLQEMSAYAKERQIEFYFAMPHIFRKKTRELYEALYAQIFELTDGILIRNLESYEFLREYGYKGNIVTDYNLYQFNREAKDFWLKEGISMMTAPLELNYKELGELGLEQSELMVYGHYPMMVSAQCVQKTMKGCSRKAGRLTLTDRYRKSFVVKNFCKYCYNVIYNTAPLVLADQVEEIQALAPKALRLQFTIEDEKEVKEILRLYDEVFHKGAVADALPMEFTRGHFKRGIK
ncbi:MAG: DUF3656 domain-containing protein [Faecalimonas sp.]|nr:DUF3656 domain-containing protein [Faecalimonas sp.]